MTKLIWYVEFALGDFYNILTMMPEIIKEKKPSEIEIWVDSIYCHDNKFKKHREAMNKLLIKAASNNIKLAIYIVPKEYGTYLDLYYQGNERIEGIKYEDIKNDFLFRRSPNTKAFMKTKIKEEDIFIYGAVANHNYEWKDGMNIPLNYKKTPIKIKVENEEKLDKLLKKRPLLIHYRLKGKYITKEYFNEIGKYCTEKGLKYIFIEDLFTFEECLYLIEKVDYMLTGSSMFTLHRLMFNKLTIVCSPYGFGKPEVTYTKEQLENPNYVFLNADEPLLDKVKEEIGKWNLKIYK